MVKKPNYSKAIADWQAAHSKKTFFAFVQFLDVALNELPRVYLATVPEIAARLRATAAGRGDTILHERKVWTSRAFAAGTIDEVPLTWRFSEQRVSDILDAVKA